MSGILTEQDLESTWYYVKGYAIGSIQFSLVCNQHFFVNLRLAEKCLYQIILESSTIYKSVRDLVEKCTCPTQFPMIRVSEGKYRIGDTKVLIFVRILRSHVMVRVGGGWDTLSHYLDKHDPCRCRTSHRSMISAKLIQKAGGSFDLGNAQVHYERSPPRTRRSSASSVGSCAGTTQPQQQSQILQTPKSMSNNRSRSPTPIHTVQHLGEDLIQSGNRSRSPTPHTKGTSYRQVSDLGIKQRSRSPTPKSKVKSGRSSPLDATRKALNEEIRQIKYDNRSQMYHNRHQDNYQDPKKDLHQEIRAKVPLSEEFTKRYVVEGGVARRTFDKGDTPKYHPTIYNYKCGQIDSSSSNSTPNPPALKEETVESIGKDVGHYSKLNHDGEHSDNGSEVSDEGYRSLGAVQPPVITSNNATATTTATANAIDITNNRDLTMVVNCQKQPSSKMNNERSCVETESIETGLRKTKILPVSSARASPSRSVNYSTGQRTPRANSFVRENNTFSRCSLSGYRTPPEENSSPEGSPLKRGAVRNSIKKIPSGGAIGAPSTMSRASMVPGYYQSCSANGSNTWNGRQSKQRAALLPDTFVNPSSTSINGNSSVNRASPTSFSRKNSMRQSLPKSSGSNAIQYDQNGRRVKPTTSVSLQSSPTKVTNPLLEQILQKVSHLQSDKQVVQKLQDFLRNYQHQDNENEANLEFTRAWIDGNGTVTLPPHDVNLVTTPRKDLKSAAERSGGYSRIPAPVYKREMSVISDNI
ncbi:hypothetical protein PV325_000577 [Microctonus aethiopoides]|nr:hypothetical protein PV325_000577 [Microctonus aethiopoides]